MHTETHRDLSHRDHTPPHVWHFFEDDPEPAIVTACAVGRSALCPDTTPAACRACYDDTEAPEPEPFSFPISTRTAPPLYDVLPAVCASAARHDLMHAGALS